MNENNFNFLMTLLEKKDYKGLHAAFINMNEVDVALFIEELPKHKVTLVFRTLPKDIAAEVFAELPSDIQEDIITAITDQEISEIIDDLFVDDAVDLLEELPANVVKRVLQNANSDTRNLINQFLKYKENTAGSIMTAELIDLPKNLTVANAFLRIRRTAFNKETIYTCYVTDAQKRLEGVITVKNLLLAKDTDLIADIMETDIIYVKTDDDKEAAATLFIKYNFLSLPVVDNEHRLVGIVTVDDAVEVISEEATEDFEKMAAMLPSDKPYLKTSVFSLAKNRIIWLLVLMVSAMITGLVLEKYEAAFSALPLLVTFIPMLTDTGGNAGSQSSTLIIRGMALSEIKLTDFIKIFWKELRVSLLVGFVLSIVNFIRLLIMYPGNSMMALTVALSLMATVVIAKTVGGLLPLVAKLIKADPAIMAAPLITTIVDAFSLIIYFNIASHLLKLS